LTPDLTGFYNRQADYNKRYIEKSTIHGLAKTYQVFRSIMQQTKPSLSKTFLTILGLSAIGFILWLAFTFLLYEALIRLGFNSDFWPMLTALSTAIAAGTILSSAFLVYRELKDNEISRSLEVADRLFEELNSPENIAARRYVYLELPADPQVGLAQLDEAGREQVKRVLNMLDRISFLALGELIDEERVMPWINPVIAKSWEKLGPYVRYERQRRGEDDYYLLAERFGEYCLVWRMEQRGKAATQWVDKGL